MTNPHTIIDQEEQILTEAVARNLQAYQESATVENQRNYLASKKALEDFRKRQTVEETLKNLEDISRWVVTEGYIVSPRTVRNHSTRPGFPHRQKDGTWLKCEIEAYADANWDNPSRRKAETAPTVPDARDRLQIAMAEERELKNQKLRGELIDAAEEEIRDARLWGAVRADIENRAPNVINEMIERVLALDLSDVDKAEISALVPTLRTIYEDFIDEMFDRYAREGGIVVEV